jgi:hypothetical protein
MIKFFISALLVGHLSAASLSPNDRSEVVRSAARLIEERYAIPGGPKQSLVSFATQNRSGPASPIRNRLLTPSRNGCARFRAMGIWA